jgi:tetratricopeptide (TPR) repeat protein
MTRTTVAIVKRYQQLLLVLVALEAGITMFAAWRAQRTPRLPEVSWIMVEDAVAAQIQDAERRLQPNQPADWLELAAAYRAFGLFPQADHCFRQVEKLAPKDPTYLYQWGLCLDLMGDTREATRCYERVLARLDPARPEFQDTIRHCWLNIGQDRLREEHTTQAETALRQAIALPKAKLLLSRNLIRAGRAAEALPLLEPMVGETPDLLDSIQMLSWAQAALGQTNSAWQHEERTARTSRTLSKWDPLYQQVLLRRQRMGSEAWHQTSLELSKQGKLEEARPWSQKALAAVWNEERAQQLARIEFLSGRYADAIRISQESIQRVGASAATLDLIGVAAFKTGQTAAAEDAWRQAAEIEPTPNLYDKLVQLRRAAGDAAGQRHYQGLSQFQIGKNAWIRNDVQTARAQLEAAVQLIGNHAPAWFYLAEARRQSGDAAGAAAAYKRCLELNPNHGRALRALDRLR